nr:site-specific integrase [Microbacterium lemovicicum]
MKVSPQVHVGTPKSHRSRSAPFPGFLLNPLHELIAGKSADQLVFGDGTSHLLIPASRNGWITAAVREARAADPTMPRVTPHDLRHTAASLAVQAGAHVTSIQRGGSATRPLR